MDSFHNTKPDLCQHQHPKLGIWRKLRHQELSMCKMIHNAITQKHHRHKHFQSIQIPEESYTKDPFELVQHIQLILQEIFQ
jgi:hypothetical protein